MSPAEHIFPEHQPSEGYPVISTTAFNSAYRSDLRQQLQQCARARGRLHRLRCMVEAFDALLAPRFVTTLGAMTVLVMASLALLS
ncbi:MAG: hypothetical protein ABI633_06535 [Burkholderiales bacterium]